MPNVRWDGDYQRLGHRRTLVGDGSPVCVIYLPPCVDPASRHSLYSVRSGSLAEQVEPGPRLTPVTDTRGHETMYMRPQRAAATGHIPRPLWPSTSTKNPAYPDTRNVDSMFGLDTVTTLPEATIAVFEDQGRLARTIDVNVAEAADTMRRLGGRRRHRRRRPCA